MGPRDRENAAMRTLRGLEGGDLAVGVHGEELGGLVLGSHGELGDVDVDAVVFGGNEGHHGTGVTSVSVQFLGTGRDREAGAPTYHSFWRVYIENNYSSLHKHYHEKV